MFTVLIIVYMDVILFHGLWVVLLVLIFSGSRRLIARWIKRETTVKMWASITTIVAAPMLYMMLFVCLLFWAFSTPEREFNQQSWHVDAHLRYEMTADIIESRMLIGKSKAEVRQLLESYQDKQASPTMNTDTSNQWRYYVGRRPGMSSDDGLDVLYIYFDKGKVSKVEQHRI